MSFLTLRNLDGDAANSDLVGDFSKLLDQRNLPFVDNPGRSLSVYRRAMLDMFISTDMRDEPEGYIHGM